MKICPTCGRSIPGPHRPKRVCARCGRQIKRYDKWGFNDQGRAEHRICSDPTNYPHEEARAAPQQGLLDRDSTAPSEPSMLEWL